jgi:hypothetical protein
MTDEQERSTRKALLSERVWPAFAEMDIVLEADPEAGTLLVTEPRNVTRHRMRVSFDVDRAVSDWDDLLNNPMVWPRRAGSSDVDLVVMELCERLWDASGVASVRVDRLVYENGWFEGVVNPDLPPLWPSLDGMQLRWVIEMDPPSSS